MRQCISVLGAILVFGATASVPQPVLAKGLLESIFGFLGAKPAQPEPSLMSRPKPQVDDAGGGRRNPFEGGAAGGPAPAAGSGGRYKTVCVRLCDGYFFPISNTSRRRDFYNDAQQCQARCDSETRLFFTSPMAPTINGARDQSGLHYDKLKTAFLYRKTLVKGCGCRPKPWSVAERLRHESYAIAGKEGEPRDPGGSESDEAGRPQELARVRPELAGEGQAVPQPQPAVIAPMPVAAPRRVEWVQTAPVARPRRVVERPRPSASAPAWGLGAALPPVKYKHRWPGDAN